MEKGIAVFVRMLFYSFILTVMSGCFGGDSDSHVPYGSQVQLEDGVTFANRNELLAEKCVNQGKMRAAEELYKGAIKARQEVLGPDDPAVFASYCKLAALYKMERKYDEAIAILKTVSERSLASKVDDSVSFVGYKNDLGLLYYAKMDYKQALMEYISAMLTMNINPGVHYDKFGAILKNGADVIAALKGNTAAADGLEADISKYADDPNRRHCLLEPMIALAKRCALIDKIEKAIKWYGKALSEINATAGNFDHERFSCLVGLGACYARTNRLDDADVVHKDAIRIMKRVKSLDVDDCAQLYLSIAGICQRREKNSDAAQAHDMAISIVSRARGTSHPAVAELYWLKGKFYCKIEDNEAEKACLVTSLRIYRQYSPRFITDEAELMLRLGVLSYDLGEYDASYSYLKNAHDIYLKSGAGQEENLKLCKNNMKIVAAVRSRKASRSRERVPQPPGQKDTSLPSGRKLGNGGDSSLKEYEF